jgi:hypothetical protein
VDNAWGKKQENYFPENFTRFDFDFYDGFHCVEARNGQNQNGTGFYGLSRLLYSIVGYTHGIPQTRIVPSYAPEISFLPSGLNASVSIGIVWPNNLDSITPSCALQS